MPMFWPIVGTIAAAAGAAMLVERMRKAGPAPAPSRTLPPGTRPSPGAPPGVVVPPGVGPVAFAIGDSLLVDPTREPEIADVASVVMSNGGPIRVRVIGGDVQPIVTISDRRMSGNVFLDPGPLPTFPISGVGIVSRTSNLAEDAVLPGDLVAVDPARAFGNSPEIMAAVLPLLESGGPIIVRAVNDRAFSLSAPTFRAVLADKRLPTVAGSEQVFPPGSPFPILIPTQAVAEVPYAAIVENRGQAPAGVFVGATRRRRSRVGIDGRFR